MLRGRARLPVLAEISGPAEGTRGWALTRRDFEALGEVLPRLVEKRVAMVAGEGEERTVVSIALASAAAASGRRTILVECDLAQPRLAAHLGLAAAPGLHEYLRWEVEPTQILQPIALMGPAARGLTEPLVCVSAGRPATKVETLLGLQSFSHMVEKLRSAYELVLLHSPPLLGEPGACIAVAAQADAAIAGLGNGETNGRSGRTARAAVRRLPTAALGTIAVST